MPIARSQPSPPTHPAGDPGTWVTTLANGVRVVTLAMPHMGSVHVSVFVRSGSQHEGPQLNGISHFVEHMAFKGTEGRDCQRINLDAERLGAEVNAHTDKDHTAFHMVGMARDAEAFLQMLGDIVLGSTFPESELERERQVILQEFIEDEDDPMSTAFRLFDKACFGTHALAQPVIGTRRNIERFTRADLLDYVQAQYTGANVIVCVAGPVDPERMARHAEAAFGGMRPGRRNEAQAPAYLGGIQSRRLVACPQTHIVLGFPLPTLKEAYAPGVVAAALFGEGMSSPLMDEIRERRGLVYYAACSADVMEGCGQFVVEASTAPEHVDEFFTEVMRLLVAHADAIDPVGLQRARNQIAVRSLRAHERPAQRLEAAAQDLFVHGRLRPRDEWLAEIEEIDAADARSAFERMLAAPASIALAGKVGKASSDQVLHIVNNRAAR